MRIATVAAVLTLASAARGEAAGVEKLYQFRGAVAPSPTGSVIADANGNLFGFKSGGVGDGALYQLTPPSQGQTRWTEQVLAHLHHEDGAGPIGEPVPDGQGGFFGVTAGGATNHTLFGTVFHATPPSSGTGPWQIEVLWRFNGQAEGGDPAGGLIRDENGTLYGTCSIGGLFNNFSWGTVWSLSPPQAGQTRWRFKKLHTFPQGGTIGRIPVGRLLRDGSGALYGETYAGGANDDGLVFELKPPAGHGSQWAYRTLYNFTAEDGSTTSGGPTAAGNGAIVVASGLGSNPKITGKIKLLSPTRGQDNPWKADDLAVLHRPQGTLPNGQLTPDGQGGYYGTNVGGGSGGSGVLYHLVPPQDDAGNGWTYHILADFGPRGNVNPNAGLLLLNGYVYGTTVIDYNNLNKQGDVFRLQVKQ